MVDLKAASPVVMLTPKLVQLDSERAGKTMLRNVEAQAVVDTLFATLKKVVAKTIVLFRALRTRRNDC